MLPPAFHAASHLVTVMLVSGMTRFGNAAVAAVFSSYPPAIRRRLLMLRRIVFAAAGATPGVGRLSEVLKWGQPSFVTEETGSGATVRIDRVKGGDGSDCAVYFHCQSGLVGQFRELYSDTFTFQGERAIVIGAKDRVPAGELQHCIALALTHHLRKKKRTKVKGSGAR